MKIIAFLIFGFSSAFMCTQWKYVPKDAKVKFVVYNDKNENEAEGVLTGLTGNVCFNDTTKLPSSIIATIATKTINSGVEMRDQSLISADFFDVVKYPTINFTSTNITKLNDSLVATGILQIKDIKKEIQIKFIKQDITATNACLIGSFNINRMQYNVGTKGDGIGNNVKIDLNITIKK